MVEEPNRAASASNRQPAAVRRAIRSELAADAQEESPNGKTSSASRDPMVPVVQLDHVSLAFDVPIVQDISFTTPAGHTLCIVGESGTGKSTILKLILRL